MDKPRLTEKGQSSKAEGTHSQRKDEFRRLAESSSKDAELSDQPMKRASLDEIKMARTQAIERGMAKMQKYQREAEPYQDKDRDTSKEFKTLFKTDTPKKIKDYVLEITSIRQNYVIYKNRIDVKNGKIIGIENRLFSGRKKIYNLSEIVFNQMYLALKELNIKMSEFDLKCWYGKHIINEDTENTVKLFLPREKGSGGKIKEGRKTFKAGEDGFIALTGTPTAQSKFYLLAQHPKAFPGKEVTSITVIRHANGQIDIEYEFGIVNKNRPAPKASP